MVGLAGLWCITAPPPSPDNLTLELALAALLWKLEDILKDKLQKHGSSLNMHCASSNVFTFITVLTAECLKLSLVKCDGGQKDTTHQPECMLSNDINNSSASKCHSEANFKQSQLNKNNCSH